MHERNFDTSFANYRIDNVLKLWKRFPESKTSVEQMDKILDEVGDDETIQVVVRKEALKGVGESGFRRKELALDHGRIDGNHLIFEVKPLKDREPEDSRLGVRMGVVKGKSYLVFETPIAKAFGFLRPQDVVSIRI